MISLGLVSGGGWQEFCPLSSVIDAVIRSLPSVIDSVLNAVLNSVL